MESFVPPKRIIFGRGRSIIVHSKWHDSLHDDFARKSFEKNLDEFRKNKSS